MKAIFNSLLCVLSSVFTGMVGSLFASRIEQYAHRRAAYRKVRCVPKVRCVLKVRKEKSSNHPR